MNLKNIEPSVIYDQLVRKLEMVGLFVAQLLCLLVLSAFDSHTMNVFSILFIFSVCSFLGVILGTVASMIILSKDKKN